MATLNSPVELPAGRSSLVDFPMTANIQDPTSWDVLSNDGELTRHNSRMTTTSEYNPRTAAREIAPLRIKHNASANASPATEVPPQELEAQPLSYFPPRQSSTHTTWTDQTGKQTRAAAASNAAHGAQTSEDYTGSSSNASTTGTASLQENQVYSLPRTTAAKDEQMASPVLSSTRSTTTSVRKAAVPTSKYKKKASQSLRTSVKRKSGIESPLDSPMSNFTQLLQSPTLSGIEVPLPTELPAGIERPSLPTPPPEAQVRQGQAPLQHTKSTVSVRKARALHSHPSMPTMKPGDTATSPLVPQPSPSLANQRSRKSIDAVSSRRPSLYELQQPSPAPDTPLPDLPAGVPPLSRPVSQGVQSQPMPPPDVHMRPGTSGSTVAPTLRRHDTKDSVAPVHTEMASFMASSSKIIFRRFHDVHIRLLLTLQDEISALERELAEIERVENSIDVDREARRVKILSELRKLLAEYDHLFSNWNLMQASKADVKTRAELEQHLKRSGLSPGSTISVGAIDDLLWLQTHGNDLSCVDLSAKSTLQHGSATTPASTPPTWPTKGPVTQTTTQTATGVHAPSHDEEPTEKKRSPKIQLGNLAVRPMGSTAGLSALFTSCVGKRK